MFKCKTNFKARTKLSLAFVACATLIAGCNSTRAELNPSSTNNSPPLIEGPSSSIEKSALTVATWNVEHLASPFDMGCRPRNTDEIAQLQSYAKSLNADIVGLQEVGSRDAVATVFPESDWQIYLSERLDSETYDCRGTEFKSTQQKVAFAVRKGINVRQVNTLSAFGLDNPGLRHGLELVVESELGQIKVLNLHMKSGCFVDNYTRSDTGSCQTYAKQADILIDWLNTQKQQSMPFVILGDFNHRLSASYNHMTRRLNDSGKQSLGLENTNASLIGCHPYYPAPIDHILTGRLNKANYQKEAKFHLFEDMAPDAMLSDHCALTLKIETSLLPVSNGVKWQTTSAEYQYLTQSIYHQAANNLSALSTPNESWVVVMDVDETILDNSAYNLGLNKTGGQYSRETWNAWVASEKAGLVPGAKAFIEQVVAEGGKLALITNRERVMDAHTWNNLLAHGLPISAENTCLMGRTKGDKSAIGQDSIINDKDLRRQQILIGDASCYHPKNQSRYTAFPQSKILMQVGDNIEDFAGVTQEHADPKTLIKDKHLILLPNAMYGSW